LFYDTKYYILHRKVCYIPSDGFDGCEENNFFLTLFVFSTGVWLLGCDINIVEFFVLETDKSSNYHYDLENPKHSPQSQTSQ